MLQVPYLLGHLDAGSIVAAIPNNSCKDVDLRQWKTIVPLARVLHQLAHNKADESVGL
jgi:hypothetical protein